jgi:hypothetical protein
MMDSDSQMTRQAALRVAQKRGDEGVSLSREALGMMRQYFPERHARVAAAAFGLAGALQACGQFAEAQPLASEALRIRTELMPSGAWQIREARVLLERRQVIKAADRR